VPERLTRISPFFLDRTELSVGAYRALLSSGAIDAGGVIPKSLVPACTLLGPDDPTNDSLPLNCVDAARAELLCAAVGKRLPTEAEWEFAAGGRDRESRYPWGDDADVCAHAVVARGGVGKVATCLAELGPAVPAGAAPVGTSQDVSRDGVSDLGGNVSEWVADAAASYDAPCFEPQAQLLNDPVCAPLPTDTIRSFRGGNFNWIPASARSTSRGAFIAGQPQDLVGVRCARSD
jgi:formylglycine-generating enzyme required for sulfatase activity